MNNITETLKNIAIERPVGTDSNNKVLDFLENAMAGAGYEITSIPFECNYWEYGESHIVYGNNKILIKPSPFSKPYIGNSDVTIFDSVEQLKNINASDRILILTGNLSNEPLMPKNFPFYYPDSHKEIIENLETADPLAIIAVTGKHPMCGLKPYSLFEDGNFNIPSAYIDETVFNTISDQKNISLAIDSSVIKTESRQLVGRKKGTDSAKGKIIICAHMDTKYNTPGTIDNASGIAVMLSIMENLKDYNGIYDIEFVPFNGEEYYEAKGQIKYLDFIEDDSAPIKLVINIDSPGHIHSKTAISSYNFSSEMQSDLERIIEDNKIIEIGSEWIAGDHSIFVFKGIPSIAVTSSDLLENVIEITHTKNDTIDIIDTRLLTATADFLTDLIKIVPFD